MPKRSPPRRAGRQRSRPPAEAPGETPPRAAGPRPNPQIPRGKRPHGPRPSTPRPPEPRPSAPARQAGGQHTAERPRRAEHPRPSDRPRPAGRQRPPRGPLPPERPHLVERPRLAAPPPQERHPERAPAPPRDPGPWLYGRHAVAAALGNPARRIRRLVALPETVAELRLLAAGAAARLKEPAPETLDRRELDQLLPPGAVHQGMAVAAEPLPALDLDDVLDGLAERPLPHIVVLLDQVTDPHNIGAILRSAAAFGALALVLPEHGAPAVTGALAKAASGALEAVPLLRVTNLARALDRLKEAGFWCLGLEEEADKDLAEVDPGAKVALVLGAEGSGLRRLVRERCDLLAKLPTRGEPASLNVSNAAAIALYELVRRGS